MSTVCHLKIVQKSHSKMNKRLETDVKCYQKCRSTRPFILNILRIFNDLEKEFAWSAFIQVLYVKSTKDFLPALDKEIIKIAFALLNTHNNENILSYLNKFKKNLLKIKKKCEDSTIMYYNYLPGNKLPLEIRTKIISFISPVPIGF